MKILWLHQYFATPQGWGAVRTYEFARRFVQAGHATDVVCCAGYDASLKSTGRMPLIIDGVRVYVSGTAYRPHMGFLRRVWSFFCFMMYAVWFVARRGRQYDVVVASSGPLTLAIPALLTHWIWRVPFIFEVIDVWPDSAIAAGVLKNSLLKWISFRLEALTYKYAAAIVTCSPGMTERVLAKLSRVGVVAGTQPTNVVTISNSCDLAQFLPDAEKRALTRKKFGVRDDQVVVLYAGAMGLSNAVEDLVAAVKGTARDARIVWWFVGDGGERQRLTMDSDEERVRWFGSLPKEQVISLYLAADIQVVTFMHQPLFYENSPNKFFDGIAAGLPAVFNRTTWLESWLKRYECGIVCNYDVADQSMAEVICNLAGDKDRRQAMGGGARRLACEVFSRDHLATMYVNIVEKVVGDRIKRTGSA